MWLLSLYLCDLNFAHLFFQIKIQRGFFMTIFVFSRLISYSIVHFHLKSKFKCYYYWRGVVGGWALADVMTILLNRQNGPLFLKHYFKRKNAYTALKFWHKTNAVTWSDKKNVNIFSFFRTLSFFMICKPIHFVSMRSRMIKKCKYIYLKRKENL